MAVLYPAAVLCLYRCVSFLESVPQRQTMNFQTQPPKRLPDGQLISLLNPAKHNEYGILRPNEDENEKIQPSTATP